MNMFFPFASYFFPSKSPNLQVTKILVESPSFCKPYTPPVDRISISTRHFNVAPTSKTRGKFGPQNKGGGGGLKEMK